MNATVTPRSKRLPLDCPVCALRLDYIRWQDGTHFYRCQRHGAVLLLPDGMVRGDDTERPLVFH